MRIFLAISLVLWLSCDRGVGVPTPSPRDSPPVLPRVLRVDDAPYAVVVMIGEVVCSGALVHSRWVLTAAHCVFRANVSSIRVLAGSPNTSFSQESERIQKRQGDLVLIHPSYNDSLARHDVALVRLAEPLLLTSSTRTIQVSEDPWTRGGPRSRLCQIPGYGLLQKGSSSALDHRLKVHLLNVSRPCPCARQLALDKGSDTVDTWLCSELTSHSGPCRGDSGAPLVCEAGLEPRLWGLTSATFFVSDPSTCDLSRDPENGEDQCGASRLLNIFMDIHPYSAWIREVTSRASRPLPHYCVIVLFFSLHFIAATIFLYFS